MRPFWVFPRYDGVSFAALPSSVRSWLTGDGKVALASHITDGFAQKYDLVILLLVDGFGWSLWEEWAERNPLLELLGRHGRVVKLSAQFPSTTAAHVTCIHTGLTVGQSGVYEWQYYEPALDAVIAPLLFSFAGTKERDQLKRTSIDPRSLYPTRTLYHELAARGVRSVTFQHREFTPSTYSDCVLDGSEMHGFKTLAEGLVNLVEAAAAAQPPTYLFFYYGHIDTLGHDYGPDAQQTRAEIELFLHSVESVFLTPALKVLRGKGQKALLVLTADHGMMRVDPKTTIFINLDAELGKVVPLLRTDRAGKVLPPGGSPRDVFLYVKEEERDAAYQILGKGLVGRADVIKTEELLRQGLFGKLPVCAELLGRLGNLVILPHPHESVWWYERGKFEQPYFGHHGGLTATEMEIPLALLELN